MSSLVLAPAGTAAPVATAVSAAAIHRLRRRCRRCSKWRAPEEFVAGGSTVGYCLHCYERHRDALNVLLHGGVPAGCAECGLTFAHLAELCAPADPRMYLHFIEGLYAFLCKPCSDAYERKRLDLYGDTPYGRAKRLKGAN